MGWCRGGVSRRGRSPQTGRPPPFGFKPSDTFPREPPPSAWGSLAPRPPRRGRGPRDGRGEAGAQGAGQATPRGPGRGELVRPLPSLLQANLRAFSAPGRRRVRRCPGVRPVAPRVPAAGGGLAPPRSLRGACGRLSAPRTRTRSLTPPAAAQIRTRWSRRGQPPASLCCCRPRPRTPRGLGRPWRLTSLWCGRAGGALVSGWGGTGGWERKDAVDSSPEQKPRKALSAQTL